MGPYEAWRLVILILLPRFCHQLSTTNSVGDIYNSYPLCRRHLQLLLKPNLIQKCRFHMLAYVKKYYFWLSSPLSLQELSHLFERASDVGASSCLNKLPKISKTKTVFFIFHILHLIIFNLLNHLVSYWNSNHYYAAS